MSFGSLIPWREKSQVPVTRDESSDPFIAFRREVDRIAARCNVINAERDDVTAAQLTVDG